MAVEIEPRCIRPRVYLTLRWIGFPWWTCLRIMWHGADLSIQETPCR